MLYQQPVFKLLLLFVSLSISIFVSAQSSQNMEKLQEWKIGNENYYNDIWAYVDGNGREYAILGSKLTIYFIDVSDPANPIEIYQYKPGTSSQWRDFKIFGKYAYAAADSGSEGLLIFDLSGLENVNPSVSLVRRTTTYFSNAHNLFIDEENGKLYAAGTRVNNNGLVVLDLTSNPVFPNQYNNINLTTISNELNNGYIHDVYVKDNIAYCSHGNDRSYAIYDYSPMFQPVSSNPIVLGYRHTGNYNHSSWISEDGNYAYFAEEVPGGLPMGILDISDMANIPSATYFQQSLISGQNNTPHNPFVKDNLLYISYYEDGLQIFDISNPTSPNLFAWYDTSNNSSYSSYPYNNVWGVYPFLPSGNILLSDISQGLFIVKIADDALAVSWGDFTAQQKDEKIQLDWTSNYEKDNDYFIIERKSDENKENWREIGKIEGQGRNASSMNYTFIDKNPLLGNNIYRLKQVDFDGKLSYSDLRQVTFFKEKEEFVVYPTLVRNDQFLQVLNNNDNISTGLIINSTGQQVKQVTIKSNRTNIDINDLPKGVYWFKILGKQKDWVQQFVIL